jgi:hypothetical protein
MFYPFHSKSSEVKKFTGSASVLVVQCLFTNILFSHLKIVRQYL